MMTINDILEKSELPKALLSWYDFASGSSILLSGRVSAALKELFAERKLHVFEEPAEGEKYDYIFAVPGAPASIEELAALLKDDGRFLLVSDNRFGLKYMCGAVDESVTKPFAGINLHAKGLPNGEPVDRASLSMRLSAVFAKHKFYYPASDWRLPQIIFTDECLPETDIVERVYSYSLRNDVLVGTEEKLWKKVIDNGAFTFHANSFLVECVKNPEVPLCPVLYSTASIERGKEYASQVCILEGGTVEKTAFSPEATEGLRRSSEAVRELKQRGIPVVEHQFEEGSDGRGRIIMPRVNASLTSEHLRKLYMEGNTEEIEKLIDRFWDIIKASSDEVPAGQNALIEALKRERPDFDTEGLDFGPIAETCYMELIGMNSFYGEEGLEFFDQEFVRKNYPFKYALYRLLFYLYYSNPRPEVLPLEHFKEKYGISDRLWEAFFIEEGRFQREIHNKEVYSDLFDRLIVSRQRVLQNEYILMGESASYISSRAIKEEEAEAPSSDKPWHVGYLQGSFDLFHIGHLNMIRRAKQYCDYLIVGIVSDEIQEKTKGAKPFIPYEERAEVAAAVKGVDRVVKVTDEIFDKVDAVKVLHFDVAFMGSDHTEYAEVLKKQLEPYGATAFVFPYTKSTNSTKIRGLINNALNR
ncbi:MAG: adenylyltransferase/cytidyltransferase family protein [Lachnospiraceae bacterium]|nr:adenylyltransferase/cytidyltransferase family protein [Lachnospiraceae bacterium]